MKKHLRVRWARMSMRVVVISSVLLIVLPPAIAYAYTSFTYASGTTYNGVHEGGWTCCYKDRVYNKVYHPTSSRWDAMYWDSSGHLTWLNRSYSNPVEIGLTTGPRQSQCNDFDATSGDGNSFHCDTTQP